MAKDYTSAAALAKRLIEKFGRSVTLRVPSTEVAALDAAKPWRGNDEVIHDPAEAGQPVQYSCIAVLLDYKLADGTADLTRRGQKRALVAATSVLDGSDDPIDLRPVTQLLDGGSLWQVTSVNPLQPGDTVLLYEMNLKR